MITQVNPISCSKHFIIVGGNACFTTNFAGISIIVLYFFIAISIECILSFGGQIINVDIAALIFTFTYWYKTRFYTFDICSNLYYFNDCTTFIPTDTCGIINTFTRGNFRNVIDAGICCCVHFRLFGCRITAYFNHILFIPIQVFESIGRAFARSFCIELINTFTSGLICTGYTV